MRSAARMLAGVAVLLAAGMVVVAAGSGPATADGGLVRARVAQGPLTITLFTNPTPLRVGAADVSVLVQDSRSREPLLDAEIVLRVAPLDGDGEPSAVRLSHDAATNKLLQAGTVALRAAGRFRVTADVRRGTALASTTVEVTVAPAQPALLALWPYLALPPVVVGIFLVHLWLRRRSGRTARGILVAAYRSEAAR